MVSVFNPNKELKSKGDLRKEFQMCASNYARALGSKNNKYLDKTSEEWNAICLKLRNTINTFDGTPVIFRKYSDGEVIALFPSMRNDNYVMSYMHNGQHSDADYYMVMKDTKPCSESDYTDMLHELQTIGYTNLIIRKRARLC